MTRLTHLIPIVVAAAVLPGAAFADTLGVASWYGARHNGLRTSSGEVFDQEGMTAASRVVPLGSRVRVTMADTGESVVVRVNDRMGARSAIIDLSKGAARQIGLLGRGRAMVSITATSEEPVEVAEATDDDLADTPDMAGPAVTHRRHFRGAVRHGQAHVILARHLSGARHAKPHRA